VNSGELSSRGAKDVLVILVSSGGEPEAIAKEHGLMQVHDTGVLQEAIKGVLADEAKAVLEYKAGKESALQYLIGKSMKATKGAGNPSLLKEIIIAKLG
jgi:aspartyl-tRNA(Asn)/glutamyl-tRNA(Gln) amidotransferase subunit B